MATVKSTANKVVKRIDANKLKSLGILSYDFDNLYPQRVIDIVNDSGTAVTALRIFTKFVSGNGATDKDFGKKKINKNGLTANKLIRKISQSLGKSQGVALHFNYNGLGQKTEVSFVPFDYCRLTLDESKDYPNRIAVYDDWGVTKRKKLDKKLIDYVHKYNPADVLNQVQAEAGNDDDEKWANYKGQILYLTPEGDNVYPLAPFDAVLEDMITEAQTKRFKNNTATKNFLASHLLITGASELEKDEDGNDIPATDNGIGGVVAEFLGGEGAGGVLHIEKEFDEDDIELKAIDLQDYDGLYEFTENSARDSILRTFLIPPTLLIQTAGKLGTSSEIADAKEYYNDITAPDRKIIEELLKEAFSNFVYEVNESKDYSISAIEFNKPIGKDYFPYYSKNEIRIANEDEPVEDAQSSETFLADVIGVGGTTALVGILTNTDLSDEQKRGALAILFGLTIEQTEALVPQAVTNPNVQ